MNRSIRVRVLVMAMLLAIAGTLVYADDVAYRDDFTAWSIRSTPAGWAETILTAQPARRRAISAPGSAPLYRVWNDPVRDGNLVFGIERASGEEEGWHTGVVATQTGVSFPPHVEYTGRFFRSSDDTRVGFTFFSAQPDAEHYYLAGTTSHGELALTSAGAATPAGVATAPFVATPGLWYRFRIEAEDAGTATTIRVRVWKDSDTEPPEWNINAVDSDSSRPRGGHVGIWSAGRGAFYVDDLVAIAPASTTADTTPPVIAFFADGKPLDPAKRAVFGSDVAIEIRAIDQSNVTLSATIDSAQYASLQLVTSEGPHVIRAHAVDEAGNAADAQLSLILDKTPPVVMLLERGAPFTATLFNRDVEPSVSVQDLTTTKVTATLDGSTFAFGAPIVAEGDHALALHVEDEAGHAVDVGPVRFTIDKTPPHISFTSPSTQQVLSNAHPSATGNADDAVSIVVNGVTAAIDAAKKFTAVVDLLEGPNMITAVAADRAGNQASVSVPVTVDTRAPELTIDSPAPTSCVDATSLDLRGRVSDRALRSVKLTTGAFTVDAMIAADQRTWSATIPLPDERTYSIVAEAADAAGHSSSAGVSVTVDRTKPQIAILESGSPFAATAINRAIALFFRATDADPTVVVAATLDGQAYVAGTVIDTERDHEVKATATDCAGHTTDVSVRFTIDRTPPQILTMLPVNGTTVGATPQIKGTTTPDAVTVTVEPGGIVVPVTNAAFSLDGVQVAEGANDYVLTAADRAGNSSQLPYHITLKAGAPGVQITENGSAMTPDAMYNRLVTPVIRATEPNATISATLNGNAFTSGSSIAADGHYTLSATATDSLGHSTSASVAFTIDRTAPQIAIVSPTPGAVITSDHIDVSGTVAGADIAGVDVNGIAATVTAGSFAATIPADIGPNIIVATARDRAGNAAVARVDVDRSSGPLAIILTAPPDGMMTNRATTVVAGQILSPSAGAHVTIGSSDAAMDATGAFRKTDYALAEGDNAITASVRNAAGETNSATVHVIADRTPPRVRILESDQPLQDQSRFPERAVITADAHDGAESLVPEITIDGALAAQPTTITAAGGHTIVATARDRAGNETRVERAIFIGGAGTAVCRLEAFDPANGAVVNASRVTISGRSGNVAGVKVNGTPAVVSSGSFCATVELPVEGDNTVSFVCTDAAGNVTGDPVFITLRRVTNDPSIAIATPVEGAFVGTELIAVSGTVGDGMTSVDINGTAATISGPAFTAANVRLAGGLNVVVARARNAAGRAISVSRRVVYLKDAPSIAITSPAGAITTGASHISVSGLWLNLDPATLAISGASIEATSLSDTSGTFIGHDVPLSASPQTVTVTGRDALGRSASASVDVTLTSGAPSIKITQPADDAYFGAPAGDRIDVHGSFSAAAGSTIDVAGVSATIDAQSSTFTASVPFSTTAITPIVARLIEPGGAAAIDTIRVTKLGARPKVLDGFPALAAVEVEPGVLPLVLFSSLMDRATTVAAFHLENSAGSAAPGVMRLDRDVLTFAPATVLTAGERYTVRVAATASDLGGNTLDSEFTSTFTVAGTAPTQPPAFTSVPAHLCAQQITVAGTAPAASRLRIDLGPLSFNTTATSSGTFSLNLPVSGQSGHQVVRARIIAGDGSLSPAAEACIIVDCEGPQVVSASFDRTANRLTITFSKEIDPSTATSSSILLQASDGRSIGTSVAVQTPPSTVIVTPSEDLTQKTFRLTVTTAIADAGGTALAFPYTQDFSFDSDQNPQPGNGAGFISGEVFDADSGRPLTGASVTIDVPAGAFGDRGATESALSASSDARGRYTASLPEGAHTIRVAASGYITAWRQIVIPAGAGVVPIDVRLAKEGASQVAGAGDLVLSHAPAAMIGRVPVDLRVPAGAVAAGQRIALTSHSTQTLPGLLPLGWSPIAAATIVTDAPSLPASSLTFSLPFADISASGQTLTAVQYRDDRDEWSVVVPAVSVPSDGKMSLPIASAGTFALVYPDRASGLTSPPAPAAGSVLLAATDPCASTACPALVAKSFTLDPAVIVPSGRTVATLKIDGLPPALFPSGTAVQAYIAEDLKLADGSHVADPPFTTDLLLYRTLGGDAGVAQFELAPSAKASAVVLEVGFDTIRILPYPGRLDRGTLIGAEGGRVPGDGKVTVEIPSGATTESLHASTTSIDDVSSFGTIAGFHVIGGFSLTLQRANPAAPINGVTQPPVELLTPARATFASIAPTSNQLILAEVLDDTPFGRVFRLASQVVSIDGGRFTTKSIDRSILPIDGVVREGRYLLLAADAPIAFATGGVRNGGGLYLGGVRVTAPPLGVADISRAGGIFNVPVPAKPAGPFSLVPRSVVGGDGSSYQHPLAADADAIIRVGDLTLVPKPPALTGITPADGAVSVPLAPIVKASFSPGIDASSINAASITVVDAATQVRVDGAAFAEGSDAVVWKQAAGGRLDPNHRYIITIAPTIRGMNGAPIVRAYVFSFTTVTQIVSGEVHAERIRITLPDASGHSRVTGDAGALPAGWLAVPVRRGHDFLTRFQSTAATDGSFAVSIDETVTLADLIDLQAINMAGSIAAIIPLTPFSTADGLGFVAPVDHAVTFTTRDGVTLSVAAGTFDVPTLITTAAAPNTEFAEVPHIDEELNYTTGIDLQFDGIANRPIDVDIPIPAGTATDGRLFLLARLGSSARGPRMEIDDLLSISNGRFTTREVASGGGLRAKPLTTFSGQRVKDYLLRIVWGGRYSVSDINVPTGSAVGWAAMDGLQAGLDVFFNLYQSIYASNFYLTAKRGRVVVPVLTNTPFTVEGVDSATGITTFTKSYDGIPPADVGTFTPIPSPVPNASGPYPVFANPMFVQPIDLDVADFDYPVTAGLTLKLAAGGGAATATSATGAPSKFGMLNVNTGVWLPVSATPTQTIAASRGNRIVVFGLVEQVEATRRIEIVFNESIAYNGDPATLVPLIKLRKNDSPGSAPQWTDVPVDYIVDSGARRVILDLRGDLQRGGGYEVWLSSAITDVASPPLALGQPAGGGGGTDIELPFNVRQSKGDLLGGPFALTQGSVRDLALDGNVLYVAATDGDLLAYDVSDPAALDRFPPISRASATDAVPPGYADIDGDTWSVIIDHHGRIWTTALTNMFGVVRSYRAEKFAQPRLSGTPPPIRSVVPEAAAIVSWTPGVDTNMPLGTTFLTQSDRPEATPRRMQVAVQDEWFDAIGGATFATAFNSNVLGATINATSTVGEFAIYDITIPKTTNPNYRYRWQRVTVENKTLGARWSDDIQDGQVNVTIPNVLVRAGDQVRIYRNFATYGVVTLFGFGVGLYDLNAIEHNHRAPRPATEVAEQLAATPGWIPADPSDPDPKTEKLPPCDDVAAPRGFPCPAQRMTFSADAALLSSFDAAGRPKFFLYPVDTKKGVARISSAPIPNSTEGTGSDDPSQLNPNPSASTGSLTKREADDAVFTASFFNGCPNGPCYNDHPRLAMIRAAYTAENRQLVARFSSIARYDADKSCIDPTTGAAVACTKSYGLIAGGNFGILVLDLADPLGPESLADVIWIPAGAYGVRLVSGSHFATAVDGAGRSLLVDLSQIDERDQVGFVTSCPGARCLFPTVAKALASGADPTDVRVFGTDDPRIVWKSEIPTDATVFGTLAPVADPDTGFVFKGDLLTNKMRVLSGLDPRLNIKVNLGGGKLEDVSAIVPLGIPVSPAIDQRVALLPPCATSGPDRAGPTACRGNASLGTFRVELSLPGSIRETTTWDPQIALESERVPGVITEQTPDLLPRAHLRALRPDGSAETRPVSASTFKLSRVLGSSLPGAATLRFQKGYNRFTSPWIVALADPRASQAYRWNGANHEDAGCFQCDFPPFLTGRTEGVDYFELYTAGRAITIRPEVIASGTTVFTGSRYDYLGEQNRLFARIGTVMADTVRPADVLVAAQNPPVAGGQIQETVYLHSGEVETSSLDLNAGGRAGWNVVLGRSYRSRTVGGTALGLGWDSNVLKRLRPLPTGDVEYRDGSGETWLFKKSGSDFASPKGYFLRLFRTADGWSTIDQKRRVTYFDDFGRVTREGDQFFTPDGKGNQIRYVYGADGRLAMMIDPVDRKTKFQYFVSGANEGLLKQVDDWRSRTIKYDYDSSRLKHVDLPKFTGAGSSTSPAIDYSYDSGSGYSDRLELATNLKTIRDPNNVALGTAARVTFDYGAVRDAVSKETWATGESVQFAYSGGPSPRVQSVTDAIGETREYTYTTPVLPSGAPKTDRYTIDRTHIESIREPNVDVATFAFGTLPSSLDPTAVPTTTTTRELRFTYTDEGQIDQARIAGARTTQYTYTIPSGGLPGKNINCTGFGPDGSQPCTAPASADTVKFAYQYDGSFLKSSSANGLTIESPEPHRGTPTLTANNNQTTSVTAIDVVTGLPTSATSTGGFPAARPGSFAKLDYPSAPPSEEWKRGLPKQSTVGRPGAGNDEMKTSFDYPSQDSDVTTDPRGVKTTTDYDEWRRPKHIRVEKSGDTLVSEEFFDYFPAGQIREHRRTQDGRVVKTTFKYDAMGRRTDTTTDQAAVGASTNTALTDSIDYSLFAQRTIKTTSAGGSETTITLDFLGRPTRTVTVPASTGGTTPTPLLSATAYDLAGDAVYATDLVKSAIARAYDAAGRLRKTLAPDGTRVEMDYDGWGRATEVRSLAASGTLQYKQRRELEPAGRMRSLDESGAGGESRTTTFSWDGALRDVGVATHGSSAAVSDRVTVRQYDEAGRLLNEAYGAGTISGLASTVYTTSVSGYGASYMPQSTTTNEPQSPIPNAFVSNFSFDTLGNTTNFTLGGLQWTNKFNESADVVAWSAPGRPSATAQYDSRGLVTNETRPDGAAIGHQYHASGGSTQYKDETSEETNRATDSMGRPTFVQFADGTTQEMRYDSQRIVAVKDRQNNWQSYQYNDKGQITAVWAAPSPGVGTPLDAMEYSDGTGQLTAWTNKDTRIEYGGFNFDGLPATTRQIRYKNASGFGTKDVLDDYTIAHTWNGFGERIKMTMPGAPPAGYSRVLQFEYDPSGNLKTLTRDGTPLLSAVFQNQGRPVSRAVKIRPAGCSAPACEKTLLRSYRHDASTGQMTEMSAAIDGLVVAGSSVAYGNSLQIADSRLLGVSADRRHSRFNYDARSRVSASVSAASDGAVPPVPGTPGVAQQTQTPADFLAAEQREPRLDPATRGALQSRGVDPNTVDPTGFTASESAGHKIASVNRGPSVAVHTYNGALRHEDGLFHYEYDEKERLIWVAEKPTATGITIRRIAYTYDGNDRLVGRTAENAVATSLTAPLAGLSWQLETRPAFINADGLPAQTTFVWDAVEDRLVSVFDSANGTLLKQVIHGDLFYDDPIEVTTPNGRLYPIFDEATTGSLQAAANINGEIVARNVSGDVYGGAETELAGAAVDLVAIKAKKDANGDLFSIEVTLGVTEEIAAATVATGVRLAALDASNAVVRIATNAPSLSDPHTVSWSFTNAEWTAFVASATKLSIGVTQDLRAAAWSSTLPILPPPDWATASQPIFTSSALPIEVRESMASLSTFLAGIPSSGEDTTKIYEVADLSMLATGGSDTVTEDLLTARFQALPFQEPFTTLVYARARWYDASTGTFLTPDPLGYRDSSNMYGYCAGDPVNCRDPRGTAGYDPAAVGHAISAGANWLKKKISEASLATPDTGIGIVDALNRTQNVVGETVVNSVIDVGTGVVSGFFTIGEGTGTAIVEEGCHDVYSCGMTGSAILSDASNTVLYGVGIAGAADSAFTKLSNKLIPTETFDMSLAPKDAAGVVDEMAPRIRRAPKPAAQASGEVRFRKWKRGEAIDKPLPDGSAPSWDTVQSRYWKNRYESVKKTGEFSRENLELMRRGNAPLDYNWRTGELESRELHHVHAQQYGGSSSPLNIRELTPDWHAEVDPFRHRPGVKTTRGIQ